MPMNRVGNGPPEEADAVARLGAIARLRHQMDLLAECKGRLRPLVDTNSQEQRQLQELQTERQLLARDREKLAALLQRADANLSRVDAALQSLAQQHEATASALAHVRDVEYDPRRTVVNAMRRQFGLDAIGTLQDEIDRETSVYLRQRLLDARSGSPTVAVAPPRGRPPSRLVSSAPLQQLQTPPGSPPVSSSASLTSLTSLAAISSLSALSAVSPLAAGSQIPAVPAHAPVRAHVHAYVLSNQTRSSVSEPKLILPRKPRPVR